MKKRSVLVCHIRHEWNDGELAWTEMFCGKRRFIENDYQPTPEECERINQQIERQSKRPQKHCPKCLKQKIKEQPGYIPESLVFMEE